MASDDLTAYYRSPEWQVLRKQVLERAGYVCEECGDDGFLHVHHKTYARVFKEDLDDLMALCFKCHERVHSIQTDPRFQPHFNGPVYEPEVDHPPLLKQHERIRDLMLDGRWRSLPEIASRTGDPEASISAQLRHLRKKRFGSFRVEKRRSKAGRLWEYQVRPAEEDDFWEDPDDPDLLARVGEP